MSLKNSPILKKQRRIEKHLRHLTYLTTKPIWKMVNGVLTPEKPQYRDFLKEYREGTIYVTEVRSKYFRIVKSIEYLMNTIQSQSKLSRIGIKRKGVNEIMMPDEQAEQASVLETTIETPVAPETSTEVPATPEESKVEPASGEETPGQVESVEKNYLDTPEVSKPE